MQVVASVQARQFVIVEQTEQAAGVLEVSMNFPTGQEHKVLLTKNPLVVLQVVQTVSEEQARQPGICTEQRLQRIPFL